MSYDYQNQVRDVNEIFTTVTKSSPVLSKLIKVDGTRATATKHEWMEDIVSPKSWTLDADYVAASGVMTLVSTAGLTVNTILTFDKPTGASSTLTVKVLSIVDGTDITVSVYWDDSVDENLATASLVKLVSSPKKEGTDASASDGREPSMNFNYTQIFDYTAKVSKTAQAIKIYGLNDAIGYQVKNGLLEIAYEMVRALIYGKRVARSATENGTFGWILYFLNKATWNKLSATWNAISWSFLNTALSTANANGATNLDMVIGHPDQLRKVAWTGFSVAEVNASQSERTRWVFISEYRGDLGNLLTLVSDRNFPKDKVIIIDSSKLSIKDLRPFTDEDATLPGWDYYARRIIWEKTLEFKNAETAVMITDLAI